MSEEIMQYKRIAIEWHYPDLVHERLDENCKPYGDFGVWNEGETNEKFHWTTKLYPKPTDAEMLQWYEEGKHKLERLYDPMEEQLDRLYRDIDAGKLDKTGEFYLGNKAIKDKAPKL